MLIPSQVILTYVRPSFWLPGLEILWGVMTGLIAMTTSAKQVYALRFFLGLCESSAWPGMMSKWDFHTETWFCIVELYADVRYTDCNFSLNTTYYQFLLVKFTLLLPAQQISANRATALFSMITLILFSMIIIFCFQKNDSTQLFTNFVLWPGASTIPWSKTKSICFVYVRKKPSMSHTTMD